MALDGAKFICLAEAAAGEATEATPAAAAGDVTGDSAEAAATKGEVIEAKGRKFTVGYYMTCDYVLDDPRAIGVHCEILCDAFGRVTIHNLSEAHPISVNEQIITIKRPLLDGSRIKILDRIFLWKFPKSVETTASSSSSNKQLGGAVEDEGETLTPQKMAGIPEQAPNSCPDLKPHRKVDKRFTVHNFAYCINSDDEGNTSSEIPSNTESESAEENVSNTDKTKKTEISSNELAMPSQNIEPKGVVDDKTNVETLLKERRSVTPEPQPSAHTIASTPLIKLDYTPKMDLINFTLNKENKSTERKRSLLSLCHQSDVVITSYSPRETGIRIEKSFTAVLKPSCLATTPRSVYGTPKSVLSDYNDEGSRDFIDFTTPETSKKALSSHAVSKNSSMHLIDLTTPNKLAPASSRSRPAFKYNKTLLSDVKLSATPVAFAKVKEAIEEEGLHALPVTPLVEPSTSKSNTTPQSAESVISVDASTDSSTAVIEISTEDSATPSTSSPSVRAGVPTKTPQRAAGQKQLTSTPLRTPQSLMKRAILTSAKKQVNTPLRTALSSRTPIRQLPTTTGKANADESGAAVSTRSTFKGRIVIGSPSSVATAQRRKFMPRHSLTGRKTTSTHAREPAITIGTPLQAGVTLGRKMPASAPRATVAKRTSPLRGVRKTLGGTELSSHISKTRRSVVPQRKHSPTSIGAQLVAKARKSLYTASASRSQIASRARSLVAAAVSAQSEISNSTSEKTENGGGTPPGKEENVSTEVDEVDELSRTFNVEDSLDEVVFKDGNVSTAQNVTFSPVKQDSTKQTQEINKTFSPEKSISVVKGESGPDIPLDVTETSVMAHREESVENLKEREEHISESFAEVVESSGKPEQTNKAQEAEIACQKNQEQRVGSEKLLDTSATTSETEQQAKIVLASNLAKEIKDNTEAASQHTTKQDKYEVLETLDADEVTSNIIIPLKDDTEAETSLITPLSSEALEVEISPKTAGESQGTAELLEEIEFVLNKSDELQQQLGIEVHNRSGGNEDAVELEAAMDVKLGDKIEEILATDSINVLESMTEAVTVSTAHETKASKLIVDAGDSKINTPNIDNAASEGPNSSNVDPDVKVGGGEDVSSINSDALPSASEIASTDFDAASIETEIVSITSISTPSEFDVSTIGSISAETLIKSEEQEAFSKQSINLDEIDQSIVAEPEMKKQIATAEVNISNASESTTDDKEEKSVNHSETKEALDEIASETKDTAVVEPVKAEMIENVERSIPEESLLCTDAERQTISEAVEDLPTTPTAYEAKPAAISAPYSNKLGIVDTKKIYISSANEEPAKAVEFISESKVSSIDIEKPATIITSISNDSNEVLAGAINPKEKASNEIATTSFDNKITVVEELEIPKTGLEMTNEEEKENEIIIATGIAAEPGSTATEPKTPNLHGIREMLSTPKQSETSTPRFIGLRNLMRTPTASTSAAAASGAFEDEEEELKGMDALLKTSRRNKRNVQTPQPTIENSTFTPRRSARRRASANADLTPTHCITPTLEVVTEIGTPRRSTRRRASASVEISYTPQPITSRRPSLSLDSEEAVASALIPQKRGGLRAKGTTILAECPVAEDMGAIIEEPKEAAQECTDIQEQNVKADKNSVGEKSEATAEVIEESICEEVNTKTQQQNMELNPETTVEVNVANEENTNSISEAALDSSFKELQTDEKDIVQNSPDNTDNAKAIATNDVSEELPKIDASATVKSNPSAKILDESDYEYGKEVKEKAGANSASEVQLKTPKSHRKSVRILDDVAESPRTPIMAGMRELVKTPKPCADTPQLIGLRDLVRTPKSTVVTSAMDLADDEERFSGLADLVKTPTTTNRVTKPMKKEKVTSSELEQEEPSTSNAAHKEFVGMRELLKTPKHISTPQYHGMRELLRTPKACSTPQLAGLDELMQTPKRTKLNAQYGDENVELDRFFKTPRAKDVMIPGEPASAVLEPNADTTLDIMTATTEYELHSNSQRPLEDIYKTPVSTRLTSVDTITEDLEDNTKTESREEEDKNGFNSTNRGSDTELIVPETPAPNTQAKRNLSAEEVFEELVGERTTLDETPPQKVYERKLQSVTATASLLSPFSATNVISDLPKTDIEEWVDSLEQSPDPVEKELEVTVSTSLLEASKGKQDPIASSVCETSAVGVNKDTTEELLADISAVSSMADPLLPSAAKSAKSIYTTVVDENEALRPTTPIESEISGINLLDQTNESEFSEPLMVSDCDSVVDKQENEEEEKELTNVKSAKRQNETALIDANKSMGDEEFPIMFVDSSESEAEDDDKVETSDGSAKPVPAEALAILGTIKSVENTEVIDVDDSSDSEYIEPNALNISNTNATNIYTEFSNFQPHKNLASQHMRASTPNRCSKVRQPQYTQSRRQSMGAEKLLCSISIDLTLEKSRLAGEIANPLALVDECIIEIDESIDNSTEAENVANAAAKAAGYTENMVKKANDERNKGVSTSKASEELHVEFNNFQAHETVASRSKRAATPDQVNKTRAQKISQAPRRLTLGAEQRLSDVTIDFVQEKLEKSKQLPARIDKCVQELDDSIIEFDTNVKVTQNEVSVLESAAKIENSNNESNEGAMQLAQMLDEEQVIETGELSEQVVVVIDPARETTVNEEKEMATTSNEPSEYIFQNEEAEICSTANTNDVEDVQVIPDTSKISAIKVNQTKPFEVESGEPDSTAAKENAIPEASSEEVMFENENQAEVSKNAYPSIGGDIETYKPVTKEVTLQENEAGISPNLKSSISEETATKGSSAEKIIIQGNEEPAKTGSCQESEPVLGEGSENASPIESEFNERDLFNLSDEPPKELLTLNTTQGVIFDLTEEEADEESVEQKIGEFAPIQKAENTNAKEETVETSVVNITEVTNNQLALKNADVPLEITSEESANEIDTESEYKTATIAIENEAQTSTTELNTTTDVRSAVLGEAVPVNIETSTLNRDNKEMSVGDKARVLDVSVKSTAVAEISEDVSEISQEVEDILQELPEVDTASVEQPNPIRASIVENENSNGIEISDKARSVVNPDLVEVKANPVTVEPTAVVKITEDVAGTSHAVKELPSNSPELDTISVNLPKSSETTDEIEIGNANSEESRAVGDTDLVEIEVSAVSVEASAVIKITEDIADTSHAVEELPHDSPELYPVSVEVPTSETTVKLKTGNANSGEARAVGDTDLVEVEADAISVESLAVVEITEDVAETSQAVEELPELDTVSVEVPKPISEATDEMKTDNANSGEARAVGDTDLVKVDADSNVNLTEAQAETLNSETVPVLQPDNSVIELDSDIEEIAEEPLANTANEKKTAIETDIPPATIENKAKEEIENLPVKGINPEKVTTPTPATEGADVSERAINEKTAEDVNQSYAAENIADTTNKLDDSVQQITLPEEGVPSGRPLQPAKRTGRKPSRSKQAAEEDKEATASKNVLSDQREAPVQQILIAEEGELDEPTVSDRAHQPEKCISRKPSRSKQKGTEDSNSISKAAADVKSIAAPAVIVEEPQLDTAVELVDVKEQLKQPEPPKTIGEAKLQGDEAAINANKSLSLSLTADNGNNDEIVDATSSDGKHQPAKRSVRKPSRSKKTASEEKVESKTLTEAEILAVKNELAKQTLQVNTQLPGDKGESEERSEEIVPDTSTANISGTSSPQVAEVNAKLEISESLVNRSGRKPSQSKQTAESSEIIFTTIEREALKEMPTMELEASDIEHNSETLTEPVETLENEKKLHEGTTSDKKQPAKRKGRKQSRSKQTTEEIGEPISKDIVENKTLSQEIETNINKASISLANIENKTLVKESAPVEDELADKKAELQTHVKASYEVRLTTTTETADIAGDEKPIEDPLPLSSSSQKFEIENQLASLTTSENKDKAHQDMLSNTESIEEPEPTGKHVGAHAQRPTRRNRKGSQSNQCSTQDEDLLLATTKRRGGRRRAETPVYHSADETTPSDAPTTKRRRGQWRVTEDAQLEDIQEVQNNEPEITSEEQQTLKTAESEDKKMETKGERIPSNDNSEKQPEVLIPATTLLQSANKIVDLSGDTPGAEKVIEAVNKVTTRDNIEVATESIEKVPTSKTNIECTNEQHIDVEVPAIVAKRSKRKQTVSESSQTSNTTEHIESHTTQRRHRGRRPTSEEQEIVETSEASKEVIEVTEIVPPIIPKEEIKKEEREIEKDEHHSAAETTRRGLTRNKRALKFSETTKDNVQLSEAAEKFKVDPKKEEEEKESATTVTTVGRTRMNRRKKAEVDKEQEQDNHSAGIDSIAKTTENTELTVEQPPKLASESVGGRRGRRGAAAAATVAINEVSSAHKRGTPRGKSHQSKPQAAQQQEEKKNETGEDSNAVAGEEMPVIEKKSHKAIRKRRGSTTETQSAHAEDASQTEETASSTKTAAKRARRRRESHHGDESQSTDKKEPEEEATTSFALTKSPIMASSKPRSRRKRKDSLSQMERTAVGDSEAEPPKKRSLSRKRCDSSLDSSIHEEVGGDVDIKAGGNTSSSSTTPQRSRNVPRRAAAAQDRNYDESSDAEAQVDLKRRIEKASLPKTNTSSPTGAANAASKHRSPNSSKTSTAAETPAAVKEMASKKVSTPILSAIATTSRGGRQRKPTARVQQYLEEERAKAETPKKRLLLGSSAGTETPTLHARGTPARRGRKASVVSEATETSHTPVRARVRTARSANIAATSEESRSEVEHTHSELETTHSSSLAEEKELTTAKVIKRPARRGKQAEPNLKESDLNETEQASAHIVLTPMQQANTTSGRDGRAAKSAAAAALITDEPSSSHTKARIGRGRRGAHVNATEEEQHTDVEAKQARTAAAGGRATRGGRRNKQLDDEDDTRSHTSQQVSQEDSEASSSGVPQQSVGVDADDEHEEDEEVLTITEEEEEDKPLATVKGTKGAGKKRTATTRKVAIATRATVSPAPKRGRRHAVAEHDDATHIDTVSESTGSSRSRKVVRFDAATPSSTTSVEMLADAVTEELPAKTTAPAKRTTRSRRK